MKMLTKSAFYLGITLSFLSGSSFMLIGFSCIAMGTNLVYSALVSSSS
jgi:hypothetical protein